VEVNVMAFLFIAIPVCVAAVFGTIGLVTLYEMLFGTPPNREQAERHEAIRSPSENGNSQDADHAKEVWLREVQAMERF
jgi:hypothetical protein